MWCSICSGGGAARGQAVWGLPGHVASAMVVFEVLVRPYVEHLGGRVERGAPRPELSARLSRNVPSVQGRVDFLRVRVEERDGELWADPVLGRSAVLRSMVQSHGLVQSALAKGKRATTMAKSLFTDAHNQQVFV